MSNRETDWFAKKMTLKSDQGILHQRHEDEKAREYRAELVEHKSEGYILQTFINKAREKVVHQPSLRLRRKQSRNFLMIIVDNLCFTSKSFFLLFAGTVEKCLTILLPAPEAKELGMLATFMAMALLAFGAVSEAPVIYSSMTHTMHTNTVLSEIRSLL